MADLYKYHSDHAPAQIKAVLAYMQAEGVESSYEKGNYQASPEVFPWVESRCYGYVIKMTDRFYEKQLNIVIASHPVGDHIQIAEWESGFIPGIPTLRDMPEDHPVRTEGFKYGFSDEFPYDDAASAARHVEERLCDWWDQRKGARS